VRPFAHDANIHVFPHFHSYLHLLIFFSKHISICFYISTQKKLKYTSRPSSVNSRQSIRSRQSNRSKQSIKSRKFLLSEPESVGSATYEIMSELRPEAMQSKQNRFLTANNSIEKIANKEAFTSFVPPIITQTCPTPILRQRSLCTSSETKKSIFRNCRKLSIDSSYNRIEVKSQRLILMIPYFWLF